MRRYSSQEILARPSSSLGLSRRSAPANIGPHRNHPIRVDSRMTGSAGATPAAADQLYGGLLPLDNLDSPPPPYELIDPIPTVTSTLIPNVDDTIPTTSDQTGDIHNHNHHHPPSTHLIHSPSTTISNVPVTTHSVTSPSIPPVQQARGEYPLGLGVHSSKPGRPRGPRPLLTGRSRSDYAPITTAARTLFGNQQPPASAWTHSGCQLPTDQHYQCTRAPRKLVKSRPPTSNILNQPQVNQPYQSTVYHPFSPSQNALSNRPPLSNASRVQKLRSKIKFGGGQHRSAPTQHSSIGPSILVLGKAQQTNNDHNQRAIHSDHPARAPNCLSPAPPSTTPARPSVCPVCLFSFYEQHLISLDPQLDQ